MLLRSYVLALLTTKILCYTLVEVILCNIVIVFDKFDKFEKFEKFEKLKFELRTQDIRRNKRR